MAVAWLVFSVWVPAPYQGLVQAPQLFIVLLLVDVVCGPLLTAVLANPAKPRKELRLDFALVVLVQLGALAYGLHTIANARPVALVFEVDRFAVVSASQVSAQELSEAPAEAQNYRGMALCCWAPVPHIPRMRSYKALNCRYKA